MIYGLKQFDGYETHLKLIKRAILLPWLRDDDIISNVTMGIQEDSS